jgi:soluble lytic murein transglycosylase-like protein
LRALVFLLALGIFMPHCQAEETSQLSQLIGRYAQVDGVPKAIVERIVARESDFNAKLHGRSFWGLMQLRPGTARSLGYRGRPEGLLDPETNLAYGVLYLANAWRIAGGNAARAMRLYASGYYYEAKRMGRLSLIRTGATKAPPVVAATAP